MWGGRSFNTGSYGYGRTRLEGVEDWKLKTPSSYDVHFSHIDEHGRFIYFAKRHLLDGSTVDISFVIKKSLCTGQVYQEGLCPENQFNVQAPPNQKPVILKKATLAVQQQAVKASHLPIMHLRIPKVWFLNALT